MFKQSINIKPNWLVLIVNVLIFVFACFSTFIKVIEKTINYIYPLDDTYIHMAIAKNFADFNCWGIDKYKFSSTTSSPLFTYLESAIFDVFGIHDSVPLIMNCFFGLCFIILVHTQFSKLKTIPYLLFTLLIFWLPVVFVQLLTGMEHMLHVLLTLGIIVCMTRYLDRPKISLFVILCILGFLSTICRYESLFFLFPLCLILLRIDFLKGIYLGFFSLLPVLIYGVISINNGADFIPNSLIIKANINAQDSLLDSIYTILFRNKYLIPIILCNIVILYYKFKNHKSWDGFIKNACIQLTCLFTILIHGSLAKFGWLFRYESYLLIISIFSLIPILKCFSTLNLSDFKKPKIIFYAIMVLALIRFSLERSTRSYKIIRQASINIYDQQIQSSLFLNNYFYDAKVVANDIGAISYYNEIELLDLVGLGSDNIQQIKRKEKLSRFEILKSQSVQSVIQDGRFQIAIIYDEWFTILPKNFIKKAEFKIKNNVICGSSNVSIYAIDGSLATQLSEALLDFQKQNRSNMEIVIF